MSIDHRIRTLAGFMPALPTPFTRDDSIDFAAFERFCELQIQAGATALVVCGTTGEAPTLSHAEHRDLAPAAVAVAGGRVPVIVGAGSNATAHAIELSRDAEAAGADALLSVVPYYNKPTQAGLHAHFRTIAESCGLPLILYDVPSRTSCRLNDETIVRLAEWPRIVGLKDATGDTNRPLRLRSLIGSDFRLFSGDDTTAHAFLLNGGDGCISVTSNLMPALCCSLFARLRGDKPAIMQPLLTPFAAMTAALFVETNPVPLKYALNLLGLMSAKVRLPLTELSREHRSALVEQVAILLRTQPDAMIGGLARRSA
jgi:4-hydroxy-tetrahydrodipicolinate synthase